MADILQTDSNENGMTSVNTDNRSKSSRVGPNRWSRVREAYQSGELDRGNLIFQSEHKRLRRNALADISSVSTNANVTSQKHQFHQLVERVRELQKEIVPDLFLYQMPTNYSSFPAVTPSSNASRGSISIYPHRQSISLSSGSSNASLSNQRFNLSARILERAHQIPERFWIDWQQKQMQDQIEELEYIKKNISSSSHSSLLSNEIDEDDVIDSIPERDRKNYDEIRRRSLLFLQEAQRLADERRASLARTTTVEKDEPKTLEKTSELSDNEDHNSFNFDQRSEETLDTANLNDVKETSSKPSTPIPSVSKLEPIKPTQKRPRSPISLPFTYINTQEQIKFPDNYHQICTQPIVEKVVEINNNPKETNSSINSIEDVAEIDTEVNLTLLKREYSKETSPILYSKAIVNRQIQFRSIPTRNTTITSKKNQVIFIPVIQKKRKEIDTSRSSSPTLSFKSARSRLSSIDNGQDLDNNIDLQSSSENQSMNNVDILNKKSNSSSSSSLCWITPFEEKNNLSSSPTLFISPGRSYQKRRKKKKGNKNASNLSLISTSSLENNLTLQRDLLSHVKENDHNNNNNITNSRKRRRRKLKIAHSTSVVSINGTQEWKQNTGGFQHDVLINDNSNGNDDYLSRRSSSSLSTRTTADCLIQRQCRKQTRLKRKTGSEKEKEKKAKKKKNKKTKKKERNKKSPSSTTEAEATEASLFQFFTVDSPTIDINAIFYPYEPARCADKSTTEEENCFSIQTSEVHHQQQQKHQSIFNLSMADGHGYTTTPNSTSNKKKENVRVFVRRRHRRPTTKDRKRIFLHSSSSSNNSHETISSSSATTENIENLVSAIEKQINNKQKKSQNNNNKKNIIVVNYKPVFINSRSQPKTSQTTKQSPPSTSKLKTFPTDDDNFSSATHYSRRRSLTTTSSDGSPLRSTTNRSQQQQQEQASSVPLDVPDVEDPLMFIEMMYQQLFTEDGRLRSGTEPTIFANCVKQIVTNSRRNSISSSIANGSTSSSHLRQRNSNSLHQQRKYSPSSYPLHTSSKPISSLSSSPHPIPNEHYETFSEQDEVDEEPEEEPQTIVQISNQRSTTKTNTDVSGRNLQRLEVNQSDNHCQIHAYLNSCHQNRSKTTTMNTNGFHFSLDDTDNEDLDTFSDLNSIRFNNKTIGTSPSIDEDLTHTDSRLLSSSGYQSLDRSRKSLPKPLRSKSHSENDLLNLSHKNPTQTQATIHYCPTCTPSPTVTVIPPSTSTSTMIQRFQHPFGMMLMKYLNFILISKNVLLLPLFIFLLRQRSMPI